MKTNKTLFNLFKYSVLFLLFSFIGNILESIFYLLDGASPIFYDRTLFFFFNIKIPFLFFYGFMGLLLLSIEKALYKKKINLILKGLLYGIIIVTSEFIIGLISLKLFNFRPWDYSGHLLNFMGVVSVKMFIVWTLLGMLFAFIHTLIKKRKKCF